MSHTDSDRTPQLSPLAHHILRRRYLQTNHQGHPVESPDQMFRRVARAISAVEPGESGVRRTLENRFYRSMRHLDFLPNSPTLMNAGRGLGQLSACFVLPIDDSIESIFDTLKHAALIHKSGGGTGFSFSRLRPAGDIVHSTGGQASGPVSFIRIFDMATDTIKQGGTRRGANLGLLRIDHPDIEEFITAKRNRTALNNFNLSVGVTDSFMKKVAAGRDYPLINPRTRQSVGALNAAHIFAQIVENGWLTGEPGLIFVDRLNRDNPTPQSGSFECTNPCGEQPLLPYEACNLGSINLAHMVRQGQLDWARLAETTHLAVRFLDNVIEANRYPLPEIAAISRANRKIGLGVMGWADLLIRLNLAYDSPAALIFADEVMNFIRLQAHRASEQLAAERGAFPNFPASRQAAAGLPPLRNATCTTIAPTGSISLIAGCSSGIEPLFALAFSRRVIERQALPEIHPQLFRALQRLNLADPKLLQQILTCGSVQDLKQLPVALRRIFVTAHDIDPASHIRMQAAFQRRTDNAVSKTVNLPHAASLDEVARIYQLAWSEGCKGVTVYREGTRSEPTLFVASHITAEQSSHCPVCRDGASIVEADREGTEHT